MPQNATANSESYFQHWRGRWANFREAGRHDVSYNRSLAAPFERTAGVHVAVIVHAFYPELWPEIDAALKSLAYVPFDLYVTAPPDRAAALRPLLHHYPAAKIFAIPNRGRDVLPFLRLAPVLDRLEYTIVLKLHTKKSPHWEGGQTWRGEILGGLLPSDSGRVRRIIELLEQPKTGLVGPAAHYVSLAVNYLPNREHLLRIVREAVSADAAATLDSHVRDYGFFGGTMFWARLDALRPIFRRAFRSRDFERELGQFDGTMAHAMERAFGLLPELARLRMYVSGEQGVGAIEYCSGGIPAWSDLHSAVGQR